jgi:hypothetical protein
MKIIYMYYLFPLADPEGVEVSEERGESPFCQKILIERVNIAHFENGTTLLKPNIVVEPPPHPFKRQA